MVTLGTSSCLCTGVVGLALNFLHFCLDNSSSPIFIAAVSIIASLTISTSCSCVYLLIVISFPYKLFCSMFLLICSYLTINRIIVSVYNFKDFVTYLQELIYLVLFKI